MICDLVKLYSWLSGQLIFILSSEPFCTGTPYSAQSTESVSTTNQLALCSLHVSLAHRAVSFVGATGVCCSLNMRPCTVTIRLACPSKDSSLLLTVMLLLWKRHLTANLVDFFLLFYFRFRNSAATFLFQSGLQGLTQGLTSTMLWSPEGSKPRKHFTDSTCSTVQEASKFTISQNHIIIHIKTA